MRKINILFVHYGENWLRGSEICLLNLLENLDQRYNPILWSNNPSLHQRASSLGIESVQDEFSLLFGWQAPTKDFAAAGYLVQRARSLMTVHNVDFIHVNSGAPNQWMALLALLLRVPMLTQLHCHYMLADRASLLLHLSPHIVSVSHAASRALLDEGFAESRLSVIHNGVTASEPDATGFSLRAKLAIAEDAPVLVSVGSLIERKGIDRLIDAVQRLHARGVQAHLVVIGEGESRAALSEQVAKLGLGGVVHLVGEQDNVGAWLSGGADIFVSGARSEAFGLVLVEAALANLPVIAPNVEGIPEVIQQGVTGELYDSERADSELPALISTLLDNKAYAARLADNAKQRALQKFSQDANTKAIERVYQQLLSAPSLVHRSRLSQLGAVASALLRPTRSFIQSRVARLRAKHKAVVS